MAQYEQKTDSREFEVANSQYPSLSGGETTEIAFRIWSMDQTKRSVRLTWESESVLVYMIADLLAASGGHMANAAGAVMAAQFEGSRRALVAAKRIQTSISEFVACRPGERIGAAILMYQPSLNGLSGLSTELVQLALEGAKPGQILIVENVSRSLRDIPGIEIRNMTAPSGDEQSGLAELIWTTPERLASLEESVGDLAEFQFSDSRAGATLIVSSSIPSSIAPPVTRRVPSSDLAGKDLPFKELAQINSQDRSPVFDRLQDGSGGSFTEGLDEFQERPLFTPMRIVSGVVALLLVAAVIVVLFRPTRVVKRPLPQQPEQAVGTENPDKLPAVVPQPEVKKSESDVTTVAPPTKVAVTSQPHAPKLSSDNHVKAKKGNPEEASPPPVTESGGFSQKDIPELLRMAQTDAGAGRYDNAKLEFRKVLALQPGNQEAKEGLRRLELH